MLTRDSFFKGRDKDPKFSKEFTDEISKNGDKTIAVASLLLSHFGQDRKCNSGWRPTEINKAACGAKNSAHVYGMAIDLEDNDGELAKWALANLDLLKQNGVYMEDPSVTRGGDYGWVHWQTRPTASGHVVFKP